MAASEKARELAVKTTGIMCVRGYPLRPGELQSIAAEIDAAVADLVEAAEKFSAFHHEDCKATWPVPCNCTCGRNRLRAALEKWRVR